MADADKIARFISKLIELTQNSTLAWTVAGGPGNTVLTTSLNEYTLRLSRERTQRVQAGGSGGLLGGLTFGTTISPQWVPYTAYKLEFLDELDRVVYSIDDRSGLSDLFESASFEASGVGELMESLIKQ